MPISLRPNARIKFSLSGDASIPVEARPVFIGRFLNSEEALKADEAWNESIKGDKTDRELREAALADVAVRLIGWENIPGDFTSIEQLKTLLTYQEIGELRTGLRKQTSLGDEDAKK